MNQADRRRQVLLAWAFVMRGRGEQIPVNDQLAHIAAVRSIPPGLRTPLVNRWAGVINQLMWLSDQGHPDPVAQVMNGAPQPGSQPPPPRQGPPQPGPATSTPGGVDPATMDPDRLRHEIERVAGAARQAVAQGRDDLARGWLTRKGQLQNQLLRLGKRQPEGNGSMPGPAAQPQVSAAEPDPAGPGDDDVVDAELVEDRVGESGPANPADRSTAARDSDESEDDGLDPLQRLMMWRDQQGHDELKDRHLRQIVNSGAQNSAEVAAGLPASLKPLADGVAAVLGFGQGHPDQPGPDRESPEAHAARQTPGRNSRPASPVAAHDADRDEPAELNPGAVTWLQPVELSGLLSGFATMDFSEPAGEPGPLKASSLGDGSTNLRWPAYQGAEPVVIYRVVADDEHVPYSPDMSETIAVTRNTTLIDRRPFWTAVRHYQVWINTGADESDALLAQPRLHAKVPVVAKPAEVDIREDQGRVIGQWSVFAGVRKVQIYRVPAERAHGGAGDPTFRILEGAPSLGGFVDEAAEPGRRYIYQLLAEAEVEGTPQLSLPTVVQVTTSAVLHPVPDLRCQLGVDEENPQFDLTWSQPPAGRVVIYRTSDGPLPGAEAETVPEDALVQMRLRPDDRLAHPIEIDAQRVATMRNVPWPRGWARTYFTPVTLIEGRAQVGATTSQVRTGAVTDAEVVERVTGQVLTMSWPIGAANIKVYASPMGQSDGQALNGAEPIAEISEDAYRRLGGLHFTRPLDSGGCDLHLVPVSFAGGRSVEGKAKTVRYKGLLKLWYGIEIKRGLMGRGGTQLMVRVRSDRPNPSSPPFALVHNDQRLPLDVADGNAVSVRVPVDGAQAGMAPPQPMARFRPPSLSPQWSQPWVADITGAQGYFRVFVDLPPNPNQGTVALLDPPVQSLFWGGR